MEIKIREIYDEVQDYVKKHGDGLFLGSQASSDRPYIMIYMSGSNHLDYEFKNNKWIIHLDLNYGHRKILGEITAYNSVNYKDDLWKKIEKPIRDHIEELNKIFKETFKSKSIKFIMSRVKRKLFASSVMIKPYSKDLFKNIDVPMQHRAPHEDYGDREEWEDTDYNYRLDAPVEEIYYAFTKSKVIGHIGLDGDDKIIAVYVDPQYRRKGVSLKMHEEIFKRSARVLSDDPSAMEPEEKATWEKLMKKMPDNIEKMKDGSFVYRA